MAPIDAIWLFFRVDVAFTYHFVAPYHSSSSIPIGMLVILTKLVKNY